MQINMELYSELLNTSWLSQCGEAIDGLYDFEVYRISDKNKAIKEIKKDKWSNITLEAQNELTTFLFLNHSDEYNQNWNEQVKKIKNELYPELAEKLKSKNILDEFVDDIEWNIISILMLSFYSEFGFQSDFLSIQ